MGASSTSSRRSRVAEAQTVVSSEADTGKAPTRDPVRLIIAAIAASGVGSLSVGTLPFIVGSTIDGLGLSNAQAGFLAMVETGAVGTTALLIGTRMKSLSRARLAIVAALVIALTNSVSAFAPGYGVLLVLRALTGIGSGLAVAASKATVADARNPDRFFALMLAIGGIGMAVLLQILPFASDALQHKGVFLTLAATALIALPLFFWLPGAPVDRVVAPGESAEAGRIPLVPATFVLAAIALDGVGGGAIWGFSERIGLETGLPIARVGFILAIMSLCGVAASFGAAALGGRVGRMRPLIVGLIAQAAGGVCMAVVLTPTGFAMGQFLYMVGWYFHFPYIVAAAALLDPYGRLVAASYGLFMLSAAIGPAAGGLLITAVDYSPLAWMILVGSLMAILLMVPVGRALRTEPAEVLST